MEFNTVKAILAFIIGVIITLILVWLFIFALSKGAWAGTTMQTISETTLVIRMDKIAEQIKEAKRVSQKGLSKERLQQIWEQATQVLSQTKDEGAMVFTSSIIIESGESSHEEQ